MKLNDKLKYEKEQLISLKDNFNKECENNLK